MWYAAAAAAAGVCVGSPATRHASVEVSKLLSSSGAGFRFKSTVTSDELRFTVTTSRNETSTSPGSNRPL
jgi:hypothetical protein